ncbi:MAG TPA: SDR family oxidoreductase [Ktedonobacteraceae bacterium]|nr:SDR family oxidoreductase [Ktedonobacteraceae bacterium]
MRVFVTGATGYIGSAIVRELLAAGHQVLGLARSEAGAASLASVGAEVQHGALDDLDSLRSGAAASDGVIHTAFIHDFSDFARATQTDLRAIETIGAVLEGTGKPFVVTSGILMLAFLLPPGRLGTEKDVADAGSVVPRIAAENATIALSQRGVRSSVVRLPPSVHGEGDHGFVPTLINIARARGVSAYPGDGSNRWPSVHRLDAAHLYRLALEKAQAGSVLHAVADEGVPVREIAGVIGRRLGVPVVALPAEEASGHFGFLGQFFSLDSPASSALTQQWLGWHPVQSGLLADLDGDYYFTNEAWSKYR